METHSGSFGRDGKFGGRLWCFQPTVLQNGSLAAPCCTPRARSHQLLGRAGFPVSNAAFWFVKFKAKRTGCQPPDIPSSITLRLPSPAAQCPCPFPLAVRLQPEVAEKQCMCQVPTCPQQILPGVMPHSCSAHLILAVPPLPPQAAPAHCCCALPCSSGLIRGSVRCQINTSLFQTAWVYFNLPGPFRSLSTPLRTEPTVYYQGGVFGCPQPRSSSARGGSPAPPFAGQCLLPAPIVPLLTLLPCRNHIASILEDVREAYAPAFSAFA